MRVRRILPAILASLALLVTVVPATAERGDDTDRASKNGRVEGAVQQVQVVIEYGRPNVKGREIWGGLVPYGKVWRTGADEATTISFNRAVLVEGEPLAGGTYSLFTIPGESEWTVIFNRVAEQWGAYDYSADQDALRVAVAPAASDPTEELTFAIEGDQVVLRWEELALGFTVAAAD